MEEWLLKAASTVTAGTASGWLLVLLGLIYLNRDRREDQKLTADINKLSAEDREALRSGYAAEVSGLRQENRDLRAEMQDDRHDADQRYKLCQQENEQLRKMLVEVRSEIEGLKRRVATDAVELARLGGKPIV
jgi:predicted RNase H-like nuclease (RuvC/YqgF family)